MSTERPTPETDANELTFDGAEYVSDVVSNDFARKLERERDEAIALLAGWCDAVKNNGTGWDDWDEWYKDACYRPGPLRELIDAKMEALRSEVEG